MQPQTHHIEEVKIKFKENELNGIITFPLKEGPYPAIILLHGSDRSGFENPYYKEHAEKLIEAGFAVLRYEGPGWGNGSAEAEFETLEFRTEEAVSLVKYMQSRVDIKSHRVGLWGISQGGWICQMSAVAYDQVAFIIPVSGPGVSPGEQEVFRVEASSKADGLSEDEIRKAVLVRQLMIDILLPAPPYQEVNLALAAQFGSGPWDDVMQLMYGSEPIDPFLEFNQMIRLFHNIKDESWAKFLYLDQVLPAFDSLAPEEWGTAKSQIRAVYEIDPIDFLTKVKCPVLAIFGEKDKMIPVDKSVKLYKKYLSEAGNEDVSIQVFPEADHGIQVRGNYAEGYFELIINWLTSVDQ